ncbi:MAG: aspartyl protease family protein [Williamsia sp.]|nr:aspartyl protease family protein [Williamsia sp.]
MSEKEYFKLKSFYEDQIYELSKKSKLYYGAFLYNVFNQNMLSSRYVDTLFQYPVPALTDSQRMSLFQLQRDNFIKTFSYSEANVIDDSLLFYYRKRNDSSRITEIKTSKLIDHALASISKETLLLHKNDTLTWQRDRIGLMEVPVQVQHSTYSFVFDTRASISVITKTYAEKLHLKLLPVSYEEHSGITGNAFRSGLAVADSIYLGRTLVLHTVFQVIPDSVLAFPMLGFSINGIVGFPLIKELEQVQFFKTGKLVIAGEGTTQTLHNLALDGSTTVVSFRTENDSLPFHFDLGATSTILYHTYLEKFKTEVTQHAHLTTSQIGGAGGTENRQVYVLPDFRLSVAGKTVSLDSVDVLTKPIYPGQRFYGNIGQDLVNKFAVMTINFKNMYIDFE